LLQQPDYSYEVLSQQLSAKLVSITKESRQFNLDNAASVRQSLTPELQRSFDLANEKGVSVWLTCLPIDEYGFCLHKRDFLDAMALRYGWSPANIPTLCACGVSFTIRHILSCPKGGLLSISHNETKDLTACTYSHRSL
jgi:hypothetical protein